MSSVLIVDDEKIEREGLKYLISRETEEHRIFEASNGKQALQILHTEDIQLLLTDIKMPHMTGLELEKRQKRNIRIFRSLYSAGSVISLLRRKQSIMVLQNIFLNR